VPAGGVVGVSVDGGGVVGGGVVGGAVDGGGDVGGGVDGGGVDGGGVVGGAVFFVCVGDPLPLPAGFADFDADGDVFPVTGTTLMPAGGWLVALPVVGTVPDGPALAADDPLAAGAVVLVPRTDVELLLCEISTAMIAMTRTAAPTIPAIRMLREPGRCGGAPPASGIISGATAYRSLLVSVIGKLGTTGRSEVDGPS